MTHENKVYDALKKFINSHQEWLLADYRGKTFALQKNEIEIEILNDQKIFLSFIDELGFQTWRIVEAEFKTEKVSLRLSRNFARENRKIEFIPREKAANLGEDVELARLEKANKIGQLIVSEKSPLKLKRVELKKENSRLAEIIIENRFDSQTAVLTDVSASLAPEFLLSSAIIRLKRLAHRKKYPVNEIWILDGKKKLADLRKLHACLRVDWKNRLKLKELSQQKEKRNSKGDQEKRPEKKKKIIDLESLSVSDLWRFRSVKLKPFKDSQLSSVAGEIIRLDPEKIDCLYTGSGETIRYSGLPFVRIRKVFEKEKAWFGFNRNRQILNKDSYEDFYELFEHLQRYRRFDSPNKQHVFYREAPEAWLESILRKNIKLLDANLILSPIYNQFRTFRDKIDLLALRKDGRLVIIELKVFADREMIFQAVDYWRKIELQRRRGILDRAKIFGNLDIADNATIIYLVAPTLGYHRDFNLLARTISDELEIFRFDLAENWRENLKVLGRRKI